jgi:hypothetical protein
VYSFQGQFTLALAYNGVSKYSWQTVGNVFATLSGAIAAGLYGNIGAKVLYIEVVERRMRGPSLLSKRGRVIWSFMIIVYWALAFVVGSAIPQVQTISGLIAAICIMRAFSPRVTSFPRAPLTDVCRLKNSLIASLPVSVWLPPSSYPSLQPTRPLTIFCPSTVLMFAYMVRCDAGAADGAYNPHTKTIEHVDTWNQWSRWRRVRQPGIVGKACHLLKRIGF